jgi:alpha-glucosidase (family GH31 glycosyl hydrolase)
MAVDWFVTRLKRLQDTMGIDGFKFDAGEPCFLPRGSETSRPLEYPGEYTQIWVNKVASRFPISEVRSGYLTTEYSGLVRMGDRDSVWGLDNGLQSLIPALLTSSVLGYHFCLPDMVGGNAYWGQYPDTELIVRWAQVSVMMPFVQWSIPPWDVSEIANALCLAAERDRQIILLPRLSELTAKASASLSPICRPLWWLDPLDEETYAIDDQFAVGDDIIIAPVVEKGARWRRLYLPVGEWFGWEREMHGNIQDDNTYFDVSDTIIGPCWITVDAPLEKLPIFIKL